MFPSIALPTFAHDHVPSSKVSHYCLLTPYLVHSCISFCSPFPPFLMLMLHHPGHLAVDQKAALKALKANIMEAFTNHKLIHSKDKNYRACVSIGTNYFVKFGDLNALQPELQTQSYIFDYARSAHPPGGASLRRQGDQVFGHGVYHTHGHPSRLGSTGSCMAFEHPTSSQPCDWSLRGQSHPPQIP